MEADLEGAEDHRSLRHGLQAAQEEDQEEAEEAAQDQESVQEESAQMLNTRTESEMG